MPGKRVGKFVIGAVVLLLIYWGSLSPRSDNPHGHIFWSLAVVRWPGDSKNVEQTRIYLATKDAVYVPTGLMSWKSRRVGNGEAPLVTLAADAHQNIAAGSADGDVFVSHDGGKQWATYKVSAYPVSTILIRESGNALIVGTFGDGIFEIRDGNAQRFASSNDPGVNVWCLLDGSGNSLKVFTARGVYDLTDDGQNWRHISGPSGAAMCSRDGKGMLYAAIDGGNLLMSKDEGRTTTRLIYADGRAVQAWSIATDEAGDAVVGTSDGPYWSQDSGETWKPLELSKNPYIAKPGSATSFLLAAPAWAQEVPPPRPGPVGPTLLPPIPTPLNPRTTSIGNGITSAHIPGLPPSAIPNGQSPYVPSANAEPTPNNAPDEPPPPPPPPPVHETLFGVLVPCMADSQGAITCTCPSSAVTEYLSNAVRSGTIVLGIKELIEGHNLLVVSSKFGGEYALEKAMQAYVKMLMDRAVQGYILPFAQAESSPVLAAAVAADEAYVQRIGDEAIKETVQRVNTSPASNSRGSSNSGSQTKFVFQSPAFHQLGYVAAHGAGKL